jgi:hypothetical protein
MALRQRIWEWLGRWGFATGVACLLGFAAATGISVEVPSQAPDFALQASVVYRAEVATTVFAAAYLGLLTLALALHNRGFTEIGTRGLSARNLRESEVQVGVVVREDRMDYLRQNIVDKPSL